MTYRIPDNVRTIEEARQALQRLRGPLGDLDGRVQSVTADLAALRNVPFVVQPAVTASTPSGSGLVNGRGTYANFGTPGQVGIDVKMTFDVPFFSLAMPQAIL